MLALVAMVPTVWAAVESAADGRASGSAPACVIGSAEATEALLGTDGEGQCRLPLPGTVTEVVETSGRGATYGLEITLDAPAPNPGPSSVFVRFTAKNGVLARAHDGSPVGLVYWRGHVVNVADASGAVATDDAPDVQFGQAIGGVLFEWGVAQFAFLAAFASVLLERYSPDPQPSRGVPPRSPALRAWRLFRVVLVGTSGLVPLLTGLGEFDDPTPVAQGFIVAGLFLAGLVGFSGLLAVMVYRRERNLATGSDRPSAARVPRPRPGAGRASRPHPNPQAHLPQTPKEKSRRRPLTR